MRTKQEYQEALERLENSAYYGGYNNDVAMLQELIDNLKESKDEN